MTEQLAMVDWRQSSGHESKSYREFVTLLTLLPTFYALNKKKEVAAIYCVLVGRFVYHMDNVTNESYTFERFIYIMALCNYCLDYLSMVLG